MLITAEQMEKTCACLFLWPSFSKTIGTNFYVYFLLGYSVLLVIQATELECRNYWISYSRNKYTRSAFTNVLIGRKALPGLAIENQNNESTIKLSFWL